MKKKNYNTESTWYQVRYLSADGGDKAGYCIDFGSLSQAESFVETDAMRPCRIVQIHQVTNVIEMQRFEKPAQPIDKNE